MTTLTEVKEKPILFSSEMVKAILAGKKTQTRRVVKPQPISEDSLWPSDESHIEWWNMMEEASLRASWCPYGKPGQRLWVRENAYITQPNFGLPEDANCKDNLGQPRVVGYSASMNDEAVRCAYDYGVKQTPSIFMPRWTSRITLEITDIRVERVQDISEEDAVAEGFAPWQFKNQYCDVEASARSEFRRLWKQLNNKRPGCDWASNPWCWCVSFRQIEVK